MFCQRPDIKTMSHADFFKLSTEYYQNQDFKVYVYRE